jgi:hypothetical protein
MANGKAQKRLALAGAQNWRCAYCQGVMDDGGEGPRAATIEHVIARGSGGSGDKANLVAACRGCNGARPPHLSALQFFERRQEFLADGGWQECAEPTRVLKKRLRQSLRVRFTIDEVFDHIEEHHPRCPSVYRGELAHLVAGRTWRGASSIGTAFGITLVAFVRDSFTSYGRLRDLTGMSEAEARLAVRPEVNHILASWRHPQA